METENTSAPEGSTPNVEETTVPIHEATDEEIKSFLDQSAEAESTDPQSEVPEEEETASAAAEEPEPSEDTQEEEEPSRETSTTEVADRLAQSEAENQKLRRQMEAQRLFIERRSSEYGELKKRNQNIIANLQDGLEDVMVESPVEGHRRILQIQQLEAQNEQIDQTNLGMVQKYKAQEVLMNHLKPDEWDMEGMTKALEADQIDPNYIHAFRRDPLSVAKPESIIQLAKRVKAENLLSQLVPHVRKLLKENQELKGKVKAAPSEMARRIDEVGRRGPQVMARNGKAGKPKPVSAESVDPGTWSDAQIKEFLQSQK